jgi:hypothetical protein
MWPYPVKSRRGTRHAQTRTHTHMCRKIQGAGKTAGVCELRLYVATWNGFRFRYASSSRCTSAAAAAHMCSTRACSLLQLYGHASQPPRPVWYVFVGLRSCKGSPSPNDPPPPCLYTHRHTQTHLCEHAHGHVDMSTGYNTCDCSSPKQDGCGMIRLVQQQQQQQQQQPLGLMSRQCTHVGTTTALHCGMVWWAYACKGQCTLPRCPDHSPSLPSL